MTTPLPLVMKGGIPGPGDQLELQFADAIRDNVVRLDEVPSCVLNRLRSCPGMVAIAFRERTIRELVLNELVRYSGGELEPKRRPFARPPRELTWAVPFGREVIVRGLLPGDATLGWRFQTVMAERGVDLVDPRWWSTSILPRVGAGGLILTFE
jgi:hypothetical protein